MVDLGAQSREFILQQLLLRGVILGAVAQQLAQGVVVRQRRLSLSLSFEDVAEPWGQSDFAATVEQNLTTRDIRVG